MATKLLCMAQHQQHPHISQSLRVFLECLVRTELYFQFVPSLCIELSKYHSHSPHFPSQFHSYSNLILITTATIIVILIITLLLPLSSAERVYALGQGAPLSRINSSERKASISPIHLPKIVPPF